MLSSLFDLLKAFLKAVWHAVTLVVEGIVVFFLLLFAISLVIALASFPQGFLVYFTGSVLQRYREKKKEQDGKVERED